jgi:hypothetical protein
MAQEKGANQMNLSELKKPFDVEDIEWRIQRSGISSGKPWAMVLAYVTNRAIMNRLDEVVGPEYWMNRFMECESGAIECGIGIKCGDEWIWKYDAADPTHVEATKGGRSAAMKRTAVHWGIGRYLYMLDATFAECQVDRPMEREGWNKAKADNTTIFWKTPKLLTWALSGGDK